ncbi:hypothetical protein Dsin_002620 [Dipteronia sinensis]|uniref:MULE transposase domain-containing protein n=1 Tax=Dipteronia sinensis TaxID=43782 RepID=A0AAE0EJV2_9ROSI|nr:hypothetical protein Dsin_002620 [Dipteronia sinensis]
MVDQKRGYSQIGFTQKDMYNKIAHKRRSNPFESDSQAVFSYPESKAYSKTNFYYKFNADKNYMLANIFWKDSHSLFEYQCFRYVLFFDSTYKPNSYDKHLVLFVGASNHIVTYVFGAAILFDETFTSYKWALIAIMDSMGNKYPLCILTDKDETMRLAIDDVFPNCIHRICGWRVTKNASTHLYNPSKSSTFRSFIFKHLAEDEFDDCWQKMVKAEGLQKAID